MQVSGLVLFFSILPVVLHLGRNNDIADHSNRNHHSGRDNIDNFNIANLAHSVAAHSGVAQSVAVFSRVKIKVHYCTEFQIRCNHQNCQPTSGRLGHLHFDHCFVHVLRGSQWCMDVLREKNSKATLWHSNPALRSIIEEFQILFSIIGILHPLDKIPL